MRTVGSRAAYFCRLLSFAAARTGSVARRTIPSTLWSGPVPPHHLLISNRYCQRQTVVRLDCLEYRYGGKNRWNRTWRRKRGVRLLRRGMVAGAGDVRTAGCCGRGSLATAEETAGFVLN